MTAADPVAAETTTAEALAALAAALAPGRPYPVAVPSSSVEGEDHLVAVVAGRVSSCDCQGWRYRHRCSHAQQVTGRLTAVSEAVRAAADLLAGRQRVDFPNASLSAPGRRPALAEHRL
jgi:hypothetical protein